MEVQIFVKCSCFMVLRVNLYKFWPEKCMVAHSRSVQSFPISGDDWSCGSQCISRKLKNKNVYYINGIFLGINKRTMASISGRCWHPRQFGVIYCAEESRERKQNQIFTFSLKKNCGEFPNTTFISQHYFQQAIWKAKVIW